MSNRYNTGNPIESTDVRDMSDNAKNFDLFSLSANDTFTDRLGANRKTINGAIRSIGIPIIGNFTTGCTVTDSSQGVQEVGGSVYRWKGVLPKSVPASSTPSETGGISPYGDWVDTGDASAFNRLQPIAYVGLRESLSSIGANLIDYPMSFEDGGVFSNENDLLLQKTTGEAYAWSGELPHTVPAGTNPSSSDYLLVNKLNPNKHITARALGLLPGQGNGAGNSSRLNSINELMFDELIVDDYYEFESNVTITRPNGFFKISGYGELKGVNAFLTISGTVYSYGVIAAIAARGGYTVTVADASGINIGDKICIHNKNPSSFSAHRSYYYAGEYNTVVGKSGNQLTLSSRLMFDYTSLSNIYLFKVNPVHFEHADVTISATGTAAFCLRVQFGEVFVTGKPDIKAVGTTACSAAVIYDRCLSVAFDMGDVINDTVGTLTQYGVVFANTWNAIGRVDNAYGYRHGVATGGDDLDCAIQCNNIVVNGSKISNSPNSGQHTADFHGNTMNSYYRDCAIQGDVGLSGENVGCPGCTVWAHRNNYPISFNELVGGTIDLSGVKIKLATGFTFPQLVGFSSSVMSALVDRPFKIYARNIEFEVNSAVTHIFITLLNQTAVVSGGVEFDVEGVTLIGNTSGIVGVASFNVMGAGVKPKSIRLLKVPNLLATQSYLILSGVFSGCAVTLPGHTSPQISLTIASGAYRSSIGGSPTGYAELLFPNYPTPPAVNAIVENAVWGDPIIISAHVELVLTNKARAFIATPRSADVVAVNTSKTVRISASYDNMIIP